MDYTKLTKEEGIEQIVKELGISKRLAAMLLKMQVDGYRWKDYPRDDAIELAMAVLKMSKDDAEFMIGLERGEHTGDLIEVITAPKL